ncbi:MAG TPA: hypothetical protein VE978_26020 [Chitinophagales bacterium]|nr:hypothetical protein [Chitinophagales bacterium]
MAIEIKESDHNPSENDIRPHNNFAYHGEIVTIYGFRIDHGYSYVIIHSKKFMAETLCVPLHEIYCLILTEEIVKLFTNNTELNVADVVLRRNVNTYELILKDKDTGKEHFYKCITYIHELQNLYHDLLGSSPGFPLNLEFAITKKISSAF